MPDLASPLKNNPLYDILLANESGNTVSDTILIKSGAESHSGTPNGSFQIQ
jgi:hypothetical protein